MASSIDTVRESNSQLLGAWRWMAQGCPSPAEYAAPGVSAVFCGVSIPFFNLVLADALVRDPRELEDRVREGLDWARSQGCPWMYALCREMLEQPLQAEAGPILAGLGLRPAMELTGMVTGELSPAAPSPQGIEFRRVTDEAGRVAINRINGAAYGMAEDLGAGVLAGEPIWRGVCAVVGWMDDAPVSCAATFPIDGRAYVGWVATIPALQRRGYAEAAMRRSLELAAAEAGLRRSVLHATPAGKPLYQRMGYRPVAHYTLYMPVL